MSTSKKKPFKISRLPPKKLSSSSEENSPEPQLKRALTPVDPSIEIQNQILAYVLSSLCITYLLTFHRKQTVFKNCYNLFNVNPVLLPELLQRYADANLKYRDEEFTQQADNFLTRIAASKKSICLSNGKCLIS